MLYLTQGGLTNSTYSNFESIISGIGDDDITLGVLDNVFVDGGQGNNTLTLVTDNNFDYVQEVNLADIKDGYGYIKFNTVNGITTSYVKNIKTYNLTDNSDVLTITQLEDINDVFINAEDAKNFSKGNMVYDSASNVLSDGDTINVTGSLNQGHVVDLFTVFDQLKGFNSVVFDNSSYDFDLTINMNLKPRYLDSSNTELRHIYGKSGRLNTIDLSVSVDQKVGIYDITSSMISIYFDSLTSGQRLLFQEF